MAERMVRIGTRGSKLALTQTQNTALCLEALCPGIRTELVVIKTTGDQVQDRPLSEIGVKGIFTKELDAALRDGRADLAIHSLKDVPVVQPDDIVLAAVPEREDPRDAFIGKDRRTLRETPSGAQIGTSSLRRRAQLLALRPDLRAVDLRGNIDTRLRKVQELPGLGGIILAFAGVRRMGLGDAVSEVLDTADWLPAPGQGALAITARAGDADMIALAAKLEDSEARACVTAERALLARLEGGCHVPIGSYATIEGGQLSLDGLVADPAGNRVIRAQHRGAAEDAVSLGETLAVTLLNLGGEEILAALRNACDGTSH